MNGVNGTHADVHHDSNPRHPKPNAIVGMACRLPGAVDTPSSLWELCCRSRSAWSKVPESRFSAKGYYHPTPGRGGSFYYQGGHFLEEDVGLFDAPFFSITKQEALSMDPQQRLLLECTYEALESAGISKQSLVNQRVGVFVGGSFSEYYLRNLKDPENIPMFGATGGASSLQANRISYYFDLKGPSVTVDTACSSSLTALHLACRSLANRESEIAIVAACHINLLPEQSISMSQSRLFAETGRTYAFDHRASGGFGRGEGCGCIILRPLETSIAANDTIRAVVVGTGVNQDGRTTGITNPNCEAQEALIRDVYKNAGIDPTETGYVEAHGTGTKVGDPLEATALHAVFGEGRTPRSPLYVGSVKSNVGHTESVSGIISIIKTAMMLEKGFILPNCNFEKANTAIPMEEWNLKVPTKLIPWPKSKHYASVNNFGFGGSNAHAILTKAPIIPEKLPTNGTTQANGHAPDVAVVEYTPTHRVFPVSGNDEGAVLRQLKALVMYLEQKPEAFDIRLMQNLAYTLGQRRTIFPWKAAVSASSGKDLIAQLSSGNVKPQRSPEEPVVGFVFTGQGAQWHGMGKELIGRYPIFAESMRKADECIWELGAEFSIIHEITRQEESALLTEPRYSQASCTAIQLSVTQLLKSWGIRPSEVVGHSSGEIAAAFAADILEFDDCMRIAYLRGVVAQHLRNEMTKLKGAMLAVGTCKGEAENLIQQIRARAAVVACINSSTSVTMSGDEEAINELQKLCEQQDLFNRKLRVDIAYHSHHMRLVSEKYRGMIGSIVPRTSNVQFHSSLFGRLAKPSELDSTYWVENLISPVNFAGGLESLLRGEDSISNKPVDTLIEVGPHPALKAPARETVQLCGRQSSVQYLSCLRRKMDAVQTMQQLASALYIRGLKMEFGSVNFYDIGKRPILLNNLPKYPWDHSVKYWHQSRLAHNNCHRPFQRNDILGSLSAEGDSLEPRWRNVVRIDDHPWIRQHRVHDRNVYPFGGYVAMAMEALSQVAAMRNFPIDNHRFREISVGRALVITDTSAVEIVTTLRPYADGTRSSSDIWYEFRIIATSDGQEWSEHCRGLIAAETEKEPNAVDGLHQQHQKEADATSRAAGLLAPDISPVDSSELYNALVESGVDYGHLFRGMTSILSSTQHAMANVMVPDTSTAMPNGYEILTTIHPVMLDLVVQMAWPLLGFRGPGQRRIYLPTFMKRLHASCKISLRPGEPLQVYAMRLGPLHARRPVDFNFTVVRAEDPTEVVISMDSLVVTPILDEAAGETGPMRNLCHKVQEEPCFDFLDARFLPLLEKPASPGPNELHVLRILEQASFYLLQSALSKLTSDECTSVQNNHQKFLHWASKVVHQVRSGGLPVQDSHWLRYNEQQRAALINLARSTGPAGELICQLGNSIPQILRRENEVASVINDDNLISRYYEEFEPFRRISACTVSCVDKMAHQNPHLNILQVGGTAAFTLSILEGLGGGKTHRVPRFSRYTLTGRTDAFDKAKEKFRSWGSLVEYQSLDLSEDPTSQGCEEHSFDLILACNVLCGTLNTKGTMANVRKLLRPGGKLLLIEETSQQLRHFIHALLPDWWNDNYCSDGSIICKESWDLLLRNSGFSGLDLSLDDYPSASEQSSSLLVTTSKDNEGLRGRQVTIVCPGYSGSFPVEELARGVETITGCAPEVGVLSDVDCKGKLCIFLGELDHPMLSHLDKKEFKSIQDLLLQTSGLLWVIRPGSISDSSTPELHLISGLTRSIRSETTLPIATLELEPGPSSAGHEAVEHVIGAFEVSLGAHSSGQRSDMEYKVKEGVIHVPRVIEDTELNKFVHRTANQCDPESQSFGQEERPLKLVAGQPGVLDTLRFTDDIPESPELPRNYVEVQVQFVGLNFKDIMISMGQISNDRIGNECSGVITRIGRDVEGFSKGDRVSAVCEGSFASNVRCPATSVIKVPENMGLKVAATIPVIFCTAYYSLFDIGRISKGESILIHAAAGGVGQAAIILAKIAGAEVYATVGSAEKKEFIMNTYGIDEQRIFFSRDSSFSERVLRATNREGVDVVLNSLAGDMLRASWDCLAPFGRFVEIGKRDILRNSRLEMSRFDNNVSFSSVDLVVVSTKRPKIMKRLLSDVFELFQNGSARPVTPITLFDVSQIETAFRSLQGGRGFGKSVIEFKQDALVKVWPPEKPEVLLSPDVTYVVVGGSGGLGRNITEWLAQKGARHVVLLSRSGDRNANVQSLIEKAGSEGVNIAAYRCDVSKGTEVRAAIGRALQAMPPIRGVIYGAMVLRDCLFEKMPYDDYHSVIAPRVHGMWNLHHTLGEAKQNLDFFINLSSAAGVVGNRGQAAYAASSTFMSAFARYQLAAGHPCTNIDLGPIKGIGYIAEHKERDQEINDSFGTHPVKEEELHALLAGAISGRMMSTCNGNSIAGLDFVNNMSNENDGPFWTVDPRFSHVVRASIAARAASQGGADDGSTTTASVSLASAVRKSGNCEAAEAIISEAIARRVSSVLTIPLDDIVPTMGLARYGLDSLVAIEIRNWIFRELEAYLQILEIVGAESLISLSKVVLSKSKLARNLRPSEKEVVPNGAEVTG